ncbi:hypothetical protein MTX78_17555 [Hymenobacter tibetensis]|uniref:FCP1 homology domain-containing protein n=1 Tax=Hymenobacter tibetensis TaxID=497967 RepID=A0ABY4CUH0_9BACT|nr:hypothetical protein [Hymenobacter tibetensis]UOG73915.1 hypothetical protein MTX78_17555 [Hymenobacter tibetensis]
MRIAFDLDNTLIRCGYDFPLEQPLRRTWAKLLGGERLRLGITEVACYCRQHNWEMWVYTTSHRSSWYVRKLFWLYGISLAGVVNQQRHSREVTAWCSKHPPSFNIDYLLDDAEGVRLEGEHHTFRVILVQPQDTQWATKVLNQLAVENKAQVAT